MMNALPYLKKRKGSAQQEPLAEKEVGLSGNEELMSHSADELMGAVKDRDPKMFRKAIEAMVMMSFEQGE